MIKLINDDCLIAMDRIKDKSVDMILCDLPYGTTACKWDVVIPFDKLWEQYKRIIKDNGAIVLFGSEPFSSHLRMSNLKMYKHDWIWEKDKPSGFLNAKKYPMKYYEMIHVFALKPPTYNPEFWHSKPMNSVYHGGNTQSDNYGGYEKVENKRVNTTQRYPKDILKFNTVNGQSLEKFHPTQKPVALLEYLIKTYTNEGELVLDNCMGSGSTGVACKNQNRRFIGIEKEERYFKIAQERIANAKNGSSLIQNKEAV